MDLQNIPQEIFRIIGITDGVVPTSDDARLGRLGFITRITGTVVEVQFPYPRRKAEGKAMRESPVLPEIYGALLVPDLSEKNAAGKPVNGKNNVAPHCVILEVESHLPNCIVQAIALNSSEKLTLGMSVINVESPVKFPCGNALFSHVFDALGRPLDIEAVERDTNHNGVPDYLEYYYHLPSNGKHFPLFPELPEMVDGEFLAAVATCENIDAAEAKSGSVHQQSLVMNPIIKSPPLFKDMADSTTFVQTGIKVIDVLTPLKQGGKLGIFGGAGTGKTVLLQQLMGIGREGDPMEQAAWSNIVYGGVGERSREGTELLEEFESAASRQRNVFIFAQMNHPPGARFRGAAAAVTVAEYFRERTGLSNNVLLCLDNVFRFIQAGSEISTLLGRMPSAVGYQPTLELEVGDLMERIISTSNGHLTSLMCVYAPADDFTDPGAAALFNHLDCKIVLDRNLRNAGHFPSVDVLKSDCRQYPNSHHEQIARDARKLMTLYRKADKLQAMLGTVDDLSDEDRDAWERGIRLHNYFSQPQHAGYPTMDATLRDVEAILYSRLLLNDYVLRSDQERSAKRRLFENINGIEEVAALRFLLDDPSVGDQTSRSKLPWRKI